MSRRKSRSALLGGVAFIVIAIGLAFWGVNSRAGALEKVARETRDLAIPTVEVVAPTPGAPQEELVLPGTMQPFSDAPIYARTNGYVRKWYVDIGTRVHAGQLLADIDTPEIDRQLDQARAALSTAEANLRLAQTTADRYRDLMKTDSISHQDLDNANGGLEARQAEVEAARANANRLDQLHAFGRIEAPFDGVVTARNTDVGALIDSGSNAKELFHIAAVQRLRVFVNVPQTYSRSARPGLQADITLAEFPGRRFTGVLARTSESIDVASRTLLTEFDVDNAKGELLAGSYADVHLKLGTESTTYTLPVNAVIFGSEGLHVATVGAGDAVVITPITLGRDYGNSVEVLSGLSGDERVIVNPPDSIAAGETVRLAARKDK
jgi:RND family efflux transporter MFP subunit